MLCMCECVRKATVNGKSVKRQPCVSFSVHDSSGNITFNNHRVQDAFTATLLSVVYTMLHIFFRTTPYTPMLKKKSALPTW